MDYAGLDQADGAYTLMTALKSFPAGQNTLAEPAWQVGDRGPGDAGPGHRFRRGGHGTHKATKHKTGSGKHKNSGSNAGGSSSTAVSQAIQNGPGAVQSRNAGASICSGLPPAYTPGA